MMPERLLSRIAALHPKDRQWLLENVPAEIHARLIAAIESRSRSLPEAPANAEPHDPREVIAVVAPSAIASVLTHEPSWVIAAVLQSKDWPWRAEVLKLLPAWQRPTPALDKGAPALKPAFAAALLERLAAALPEAAVVAEPAPRAPFEDLVKRLGGARGRREQRF
jgi:hypothetical protein